MARQQPGYLRVLDDFGPIGDGVSGARYVSAENGSEYLIKGPSLTPGHAEVAANELIAVRLASLLGLPVLDHQILEMSGELYFGSAWMGKGEFYPRIDEGIFQRCLNRGRVYDLVVFDAWICNIDRHSSNLIARKRKDVSGAEQVLMLLNDHSHCLVQPGKSVHDLAPLTSSEPEPYLRLKFVRNGIIDAQALSASLRQVRNVEKNEIIAVVDSVPKVLLPDGENTVVSDFLVDRRNQLFNAFRAGCSSFPNLSGVIQW